MAWPSEDAPYTPFYTAALRNLAKYMGGCVVAPLPLPVAMPAAHTVPMSYSCSSACCPCRPCWCSALPPSGMDSFPPPPAWVDGGLHACAVPSVHLSPDRYRAHFFGLLAAEHQHVTRDVEVGRRGGAKPLADSSPCPTARL
jgi:hypothetical protein